VLLGPVEAKAGALFPARVVGLLAPQAGGVEKLWDRFFRWEPAGQECPLRLATSPIDNLTATGLGPRCRRRVFREIWVNRRTGAPAVQPF